MVLGEHRIWHIDCIWMLCLMGNNFHPILQLLRTIASFTDPIFANFENIIFMVVVVPYVREVQVENKA